MSGNTASVSGQFGFHFFNGTRDTNAVTTIDHLFDPTIATQNYPSIAASYNSALTSAGVTGGIGARDTAVTTTARFNIQEGNIGGPNTDFSKWRVFLNKYSNSTAYPTGSGTFQMLSPVTAGGSLSMGVPTFSIVDNPSGTAKAAVISYFIFSESSAPGESGSLIYYFDIN